MIALWTIAMLGFIPPLLVAAYLACRGGIGERAVALQLGTVLAVLFLICTTFAFDQPAFIDLPLALCLLTLPGTMLIALALERWL